MTRASAMRAARAPRPIDVSAATLRQWPLPMPDEQADKDSRGRILVIAGCDEMPGAAMLAADASLRAGAGKLTIATTPRVAASVGAAVPESLVVALAVDARGRVSSRTARSIDADAARDAVLVGSGMQEAGTPSFVRALLPRFRGATVVLDAAAMSVVRQTSKTSKPPFRFDQPVILTPHAGEMASLLQLDKRAVEEHPEDLARSSALQWKAVVALKGATTYIASPDGRLWKHDGGNVGLAVSGSGDTLAGIIAGLASRGATPEQAAVWGVWVHGQAGRRLSKRIGKIGYLAREIPAEVPAVLSAFAT